MDADLLRHPPGGHCEDGGTDDLGWGSIRCRRSRGTRVGGQLWLRQRVYVWEYASDGELIMPRTNFGICGSEGGGAVRSGWTMSSDMLEWLRGGLGRDWVGAMWCVFVHCYCVYYVVCVGVWSAHFWVSGLCTNNQASYMYHNMLCNSNYCSSEDIFQLLWSHSINGSSESLWSCAIEINNVSFPIPIQHVLYWIRSVCDTNSECMVEVLKPDISGCAQVGKMW